MYQCNLQGHRLFYKVCSFSSMFCCCYLFKFCLSLHIVCHTCATSLIHWSSYLSYVSCLIFLLCCNHFTLMLYYRQHLCVALSAEACEMYLKQDFCSVLALKMQP